MKLAYLYVLSGLVVNQERIFEYLRLYIGNMENCELRRFLRFVTGSSVCSSEGIRVSFNKLSGIERRPIGHTCSSLLELSSCYQSYEEFMQEFRAVLCLGDWKLDAI